MTGNQFGLKREIPAEVKRQVRRSSRFGCVICRSGFYHYEHIDPEFKDAKTHDPENICCLCGSCHDAVTRGRVSKEKVRKKYDQLRRVPSRNAHSPRGPLDFHDGTAKLTIGGVRYSPAAKSVLRYHNWDYIRVDPGSANSPGAISAVFCDDKGVPILQLQENEWIGSTESWDIEVVGRKLKVRQHKSKVSLILRLQPPGEIVVEWLDMRFSTFHILATEWSYAVGRYVSEDVVQWVSVDVRVNTSSQLGCAIEIGDPLEMRQRYENKPAGGQGLESKDKNLVMHSGYGIAYIPMGILIASYCPSFDVRQAAFAPRKLDEMRKVIRKARSMSELCEFIGSGSRDR